MENKLREFWFIRHGESESNAGLPTSSDDSTPLTNKGFEQSAHVAADINTTPDLIVVSPYLRAIQTAKPTIVKFPQLQTVTWPIQEFTYLPHNLYNGTTSRQRAKPSIKYFITGDSDLVLGPGGESFNHFIGRIRHTLEMLKERDEMFTLVFGHGWFFRAVLWHLYMSKKNPEEKDLFIRKIKGLIPYSSLLLGLTHRLSTTLGSKEMLHFLLFSSSVQTPNCSIIKLILADKDKGFELEDFKLDHLPSHLRKTTISNR